jgi:hypothetical protein|tara:strand:+ start:195 stop:335 length:141 start_codon:yes stop_codon:yes gene_type:complete
MPKVIRSFLSVEEAIEFIHKEKLDNVIIKRDIVSRMFQVLDLEGGE